MNRKERRANRAAGSGAGTMSPLLAQGLQFHRGGQLARAESAYRQVLAQNGRDADALYLLGVISAQKGAFGEAGKLLGEAVGLRQPFPDAWFNLGNVHLQSGKPAEAEAALRTCLKQQPQHFGAAWNLANLYLGAEKPAEAETLFRQALRLQPGNLDVTHSLALSLLGLRRFNEAEALARQVLAARPDAKAKALLGQLLFFRNEFDEAEPLLRQAINESPQLVETRTSLAGLLRRVGQLEKAEALLAPLVRSHPQDAAIRMNYSLCLKDLGRYEEAIEEADAAKSLKPHDADLLRSRSQLLLQAGRLKEAWQDFGARFDASIEGCQAMRFPFPRLAGRDELAQHTVLVWPEQGIGDQITYSSAMPDLIQAAKSVEILAPAKLAPLFSRSFPKARLIREAGETTASRHLPIGDLFPLFRPDAAAFPPGPYIKADPALSENWRRRLAGLGPGLKVGITWSSTLYNRSRALHFFPSLMPWRPILSIPGITFVVVQPKADPAHIEEARQAFGCRIERFEDIDLFDDLDGAAAMMSGLDLIVGNGSTNAFLASACGVPAWIFFLADNHWVTLGTGGIPWLSSMTLVKRYWNQGWDEPVARVAQALAASLEQGRLVMPEPSAAPDRFSLNAAPSA